MTLITGLTDEDIRTDWRRTQSSVTDDDATDAGDTDADDDATDADDDATDADDDATDA